VRTVAVAAAASDAWFALGRRIPPRARADLERQRLRRGVEVSASTSPVPPVFENTYFSFFSDFKKHDFLRFL